MDHRFSEAAIKLRQSVQSTAKSAGENYRLSKCTPKMVTWSRNWKGRIYSSILESNCGIHKDLKEVTTTPGTKTNRYISGKTLRAEAIRATRKTFLQQIIQEEKQRNEKITVFL